ncbi:Uncharacterised protein [Parabacteroides distasonis]|nr:Uncharacterised protein [Parabacteroides distasonis]
MNKTILIYQYKILSISKLKNRWLEFTVSIKLPMENSTNGY